MSFCLACGGAQVPHANDCQRKPTSDDVGALRAELTELNGELVSMQKDRNDARAEVERLRAALSSVDDVRAEVSQELEVEQNARYDRASECKALSASLAAANALLVDAIPSNVSEASWLIRRDKHFAACGFNPVTGMHGNWQLATAPNPKQKPFEDGYAAGWLQGQRDAPGYLERTRTEAEQRVLDAMAGADTDELVAVSDGELPDTPLWEVAACNAEMARRGLK